MDIISKELLSEVLGVKVIGYTYSMNKYCINHTKGFTENLNIHEIAFDCEQWIIKQGYEIKLVLDKDKNYIEILQGNINIQGCKWKSFLGASKLQAIFKACQWILDNKDKKWKNY